MAFGDRGKETPEEFARRISEEHKKVKADRVYSILRQIEDLNYSDFKRLSSILGSNPEPFHRLLNEGLDGFKRTEDGS